MKKIINYIAGGQGLGIKFTALLALLLSIVFGATVKVMGSDAVPYAQQIADQMLPIKVVNGQIVEPADTYKVVHLRFNEDSDPYPIPLVLDTTSDVLDINMLDPGIYVTRSNIYFAKEHEVRTYKLANDNFELPRSDYTGFFRSVLNWTAVFVFVFAFAAMFLLYFVLCLFYSVCAVPLAAILGKKTDFDSRMRLSTVALRRFLGFAPDYRLKCQYLAVFHCRYCSTGFPAFKDAGFKQHARNFTFSSRTGVCFPGNKSAGKNGRRAARQD